ncbi:MAG: SWIM zinc finger family protein [Betaproteobacteria bacterium]
MGFYGYGWKPYVPVAIRRQQALKAAAKATKEGAKLEPVAESRGAIAKTFWGKAWCDNLEHYSDFENRLPRGRAYARNGSVIDLKISEGKVQAQVMGSSLYKVTVNVSAVPGKQWQALSADCAGSIDSLVELLQGKLSKAVMARICTPKTGLFPAPKEIDFDCSCPDWAVMCKHVAAVLYGVGARLDQQPELLFSLRRVLANDLVAQAGAGLKKTAKTPTAAKVLDDAALADVFGIELDDAMVSPRRTSATTARKEAAPVVKAPVKKTAARRRKTVTAKSAVNKVVMVPAKPRGAAATPKGKLAVAAKSPRAKPKTVTPTAKKTRRKKST